MEYGERYRSNWIYKASSIATAPPTFNHHLGIYPTDYSLRFRKYASTSTDAYAIGSEIPLNVVYNENNQGRGYDEYTLYVINHTVNQSTIRITDVPSDNYMFIDVTGIRGRSWYNSSPSWLAYYTAVQ
jgi:hypothetical protein